jgi:hypothetical protein
MGGMRSKCHWHLQDCQMTKCLIFKHLFLFQDHVGTFSDRTIETLQFLHESDEDKAATLIEIRVPKNQEEKRYLGNYFTLFGNLF